jgi:hypothetical protein
MDQPPQTPQYMDQSHFGNQMPAQRTNGMAITSLVSGILGLTLCLGIGSVFALIFGYIARGQIRRSQGTEGGSGMAMTGIVLGWIGTILTLLFVGLLVAGTVTFFNWTQSDSFDEAVDKGVEFIAGESLDEISEADANCGPVERHPSEGHEHVDEGEKVAYDVSPPTSGSHYEVPAAAGFYDTDSDIEPERLVHNLEHGMIVIWYRPNAPDLGFIAEQVEELVEQEPAYTVGAPYADMPDGYNIVLTSWRQAQACEFASQDIVDDFRRQFQGKSPEKLTPAFDG